MGHPIVQHSDRRCRTKEPTSVHRCNALQHVATQYSTPQRSAAEFNTVQGSVTQCSTLQLATPCCHLLRSIPTDAIARKPPTSIFESVNVTDAEFVWDRSLTYSAVASCCMLRLASTPWMGSIESPLPAMFSIAAGRTVHRHGGAVSGSDRVIRRGMRYGTLDVQPRDSN